MERALVTAIGSFSSDIVIKSLKRIGMYVVGTNIYPKEWIVEAYEVNCFYTVPKATDEMLYVNSIIEICLKERIQYLLPLTDVEIDVLNNHREQFDKIGTKICFSSYDSILLCRDKLRLCNYVKENIPEINIIPTVTANSNYVPHSYPIVCKPVDGRSSVGLKYIYSDDDWSHFDNKTEKYIIQPYIAGDIVTVDIVRSAKYGQTVAIARKELLRTLNGAGLSVNVFRDKDFESACCMLADKLDIEGCVNFEFILDCEGKYHFVECNPRFSGGVEFSCIAGYECVINHIKVFRNEPIDTFSLNHNYVIARKYEEYLTHVE